MVAVVVALLAIAVPVSAAVTVGPEVARQLTCDKVNNQTCNELSASYSITYEFKRVCTDTYEEGRSTGIYMTCRSVCDGRVPDKCADLCANYDCNLSTTTTRAIIPSPQISATVRPMSLRDRGDTEDVSANSISVARNNLLVVAVPVYLILILLVLIIIFWCRPDWMQKMKTSCCGAASDKNKETENGDQTNNNAMHSMANCGHNGVPQSDGSHQRDVESQRDSKDH